MSNLTDEISLARLMVQDMDYLEACDRAEEYLIAHDRRVKAEALREVKRDIEMSSAAAFLDGDCGVGATYAWGKSLSTVQRRLDALSHENGADE